MTLREKVAGASGKRLGAISDEDLIAAFAAFDSNDPELLEWVQDPDDGGDVGLTRIYTFSDPRVAARFAGEVASYVVGHTGSSLGLIMNDGLVDVTLYRRVDGSVGEEEHRVAAEVDQILERITAEHGGR